MRVAGVAAVVVLSGLAAGFPVVARQIGSITGRVLDTDGGPVPSATVRVKRIGEAPHKTFTRPDGTYRIASLPTGNYQVSASLQGFQADVREYVSVSRDVRLDLTLRLDLFHSIEVDVEAPPRPPPCRLEARITESAGHPLHLAIVSIDPTHAIASRRLLPFWIGTDTAGHLVNEVPSGTLELTIAAAGYRLERRTVDCPPAGGRRVDVVMTPRGVEPLAPANAGSTLIETSLGAFSVTLDTSRTRAREGRFVALIDEHAFDGGKMQRAADTSPDRAVFQIEGNRNLAFLMTVSQPELPDARVALGPPGEVWATGRLQDEPGVLREISRLGSSYPTRAAVVLAISRPSR